MATKYKAGCAFCPPRSKFAIVGENDRAVAIICDTAKSWGHSLIIPKDHSSNLFSAGMNETIWKEGIIPLMRDFINKLKKNPQVIGFFINSNAGGAAEQTVFHTHIHIVPVYLKDKDKWIAFFNGSTSEDSKLFSGSWENLYPDMMVHIDACLGKTLKKDGEGVIESFNLVARIGDGELGSGEHFWVIPKPSSYHWMGGSNSKYYNFQQREKIAEKINKGQWEEANAEEPNIPKKDKPNEEPINNDENREPNRNDDNNDNPEPGKDKNEPPTNNQDSPISDDSSQNQPTENGNPQTPNDQNEDKNDNDSDRNSPSSPQQILVLVKQYFQKNSIKLVELDGENWIITYEDKGAKETVSVAAVPELQDLKNYLKSQGLKSISAAELGITNEKKQTDDKKSEKSPPLIVFSVMGILLIITAATLIIRRRKRKRQLRRGEQIK